MQGILSAFRGRLVDAALTIVKAEVTAALVLLVLGVVYLGCGLAATLTISSDRTWMRFAKVDKLMQQSTSWRSLRADWD